MPTLTGQTIEGVTLNLTHRHQAKVDKKGFLCQDQGD
jgi:hypothetical protein